MTASKCQCSILAQCWNTRNAQNSRICWHRLCTCHGKGGTVKKIKPMFSLNKEGLGYLREKQRIFTARTDNHQSFDAQTARFEIKTKRGPRRTYFKPALPVLTVCAIGWRMPLLFKAPRAVPLLQPIFSNMARPRLSAPISGALAPTTSPSL